MGVFVHDCTRNAAFRIIGELALCMVNGETELLFTHLLMLRVHPSLQPLRFKKLTVTCMVLDTSRNVVVAGTKDGFLLLLLWPFEFVDEKESASARCYARYAIHEGQVENLVLNKDKGVVYSTGELKKRGL